MSRAGGAGSHDAVVSQAEGMMSQVVLGWSVVMVSQAGVMVSQPRAAMPGCGQHGGVAVRVVGRQWGVWCGGGVACLCATAAAAQTSAAAGNWGVSEGRRPHL